MNNNNNKNSENLNICWSKIKSAKGADLFVDNFYQLMFERHSELRHLFPKDLQKQKTKLLNSLDNVINGAEYINELEEELIALGQRHKNIGIKKEMYDMFITNIVATANLTSDYSLTVKELAIWKNAFRKVSDIMLKAY